MNSNTQSTENILHEILFIIFAQKRLIIDLLVVMTVGILLIALLAPKEYTGHASLLVKGKRIERNPESVQQAETKVLPISREDLNSEVQMLMSNSLLKTVAIEADKKLGLFDGQFSELDSSIDNELIDDNLTDAITELFKALEVTLVPSSKVLEISLTWASADQAQQILTILVDEYFTYRNKVYKPEKTRDFYDDTVQAYQKKIDQHEVLLVEVIKKVKASSTSQEIESNLALKKEYQQRLSGLEQTRLSTTTELTYLNQQLERGKNALVGNDAKTFDNNAVNLFTKIDNLSIRQLSSSVQTKLLSYIDTSTHFLADSEKALGLKSELDKAYATLLNEVSILAEDKKNQLEATQEMITYFDNKIEKLDQRNSELAQYQIELDKLNRDKSLLEQAFSNYYKLREEAIMMERTQMANLNTQVILLTPSWAQQDPTFPNNRILIPFGLLITVLVALTAGFINEYFDDSIKRPDDSMKFIGVPTLISMNDIDPEKRPFFIAKINHLIKRFKSKKAKSTAG